MRVLFAVLAIASLASIGCAPPKVLVNHSYASSERSIETFIQKSGETVGDGKDKTNLFNVYMRVCNQDATNNMSACKDTLILSNVNPGSL
jgi:hypothetical protein